MASAGPMSKASLSKRENWSSDIYTIVHGKSVRQVRRTTEQMSKIHWIANRHMLVTEKESKKMSPTYIN